MTGIILSPSGEYIYLNLTTGKGLLRIPTVRDRNKLEPIFEKKFHESSLGYRPGKSPHLAMRRIWKELRKGSRWVVEVDIRHSLDTLDHERLVDFVAEEMADGRVLELVRRFLKAKVSENYTLMDVICRTPQGGVISPLLANIYLNEVDKMLERTKEATRQGKYVYIEYARFADDVVILVDGFRKWDSLVRAVYQRLLEELEKLGIQVNRKKTRMVDLTQDETFSFLGFDFRRIKTRRGRWGVRMTPRMKERTALLRELKDVSRRYDSQPVDRVIYLINPTLRSWVNYFRIGQSSRCFGYIKNWIEKKIRRHLMRARKLHGFGWKRWSRAWFYETLELYSDYRVRYYRA